MKKSLVLLVVLVGSLALVGSGFAYDFCVSCDGPEGKPAPCADKVLCKGKAAGKEKIGCGPCAPVISWAGKWSTIEKCPAKKVAAKADAPKAKKVKK